MGRKKISGHFSVHRYIDYCTVTARYRGGALPYQRRSILREKLNEKLKTQVNVCTPKQSEDLFLWFHLPHDTSHEEIFASVAKARRILRTTRYKTNRLIVY